ncbi:hypothetical protein KFK09_020401 [Dendrobium nobile]|uniref:Uncharacterized protein n=1 Tax=Dendrobium nobile TaxID=94219 RepID=A0A8T3AL84_DENNO|nr:hypothetical protein KFK09_020401 [Dendrobium nobile]
MLKRSTKIPEAVLQPSKIHSKRSGSEGDLQASKKKKTDEILIVTNKGHRISPSKLYILEDVLKHQCVGRQRAEELQHIDFKLEMTKTLNDWNNESVKVKYLKGEYKNKYNGKVKEMQAVEEQLEECIIELANKITSASSKNEQMDRLYIYVKVKALEVECMEDGFIKGFMKGVRVVQRKIRAEIEGLTPSQASGDPSSDSSGEELESELQKAFFLEEDKDDIEILFRYNSEVFYKGSSLRDILALEIKVLDAQEEEESLLEDAQVEHLRPVVDLEGEELPSVVLVPAAESLAGVEGSRSEIFPSFRFSLLRKVPRFLLQQYFSP